MENLVLQVYEWNTPATSYPLMRIGTAEITRDKYPKGFYRMEGVAGYVFFQVVKPIPVTYLKIKNKIWMVDDPLHWIGMQKLAEASGGKVLTSGLGLGLLCHALEMNPSVEYVDVVELNKDVIELISPLIPKTKITIHNADIYDFVIDHKDYDTIVLDLWVGRGKRKMYVDMLSAFAYFKYQCPKANVYIWGLKIPSLNPAVTR